MPKYAKVVFNHPLREPFTYEVPEAWRRNPPVGGRVRADFGRQTDQLGFVVGLTERTDLSAEKIRPLNDCLDDRSLFSEGLFKLLEWLAEYYFCSLGEALFAAFPFGARTSVRLVRVVRRGKKFAEVLETGRLTPQRKNVLSLFKDPSVEKTTTEICSATGVGRGVIDGLVRLEALKFAERATPPVISEAEHLYRVPPPELNSDQRRAADEIGEKVRSGAYAQFLLHGVTGSGKTEVFLNAIESALSLGKTALVLVPEIALTPQTAARYRGRFPGKVEVLHSGLTQARRFEAWNRTRNGEVPVIVGTRSAVFAPLENLGLIVVDEEHDPSYKQADPAPRYNARDVAIYRACLENATIVLGSATPSLESYENVARKKSRLLHLPRRATPHALPEVELVDMRHRPPTERILSHEARRAVAETLEMGLQSIFFLNRRGHSTQLACGECGRSLECRNCSVALVWHGSDQSLRCHYCGYRQSEPETCPSCGSVWIRSRGYGTEQVVETLQSAFPSVRIVRIDLDVTQEEGSHDRILSSFRKGEIDILVGTQMVSKGLDMPGVRLVVVVQAETSLNIADFRAAERSFALLTQVAGRAGRGDHPGLVLVQSYQPYHYSIRLALNHDYLEFRRHERRLRYHLGLPPHTRLVNIRLEGENEETVRDTGQVLAQVFSPVIERYVGTGCRMIGPTPCPLERLHGRYRWQVLIVTTTAGERSEILALPEIQKALQKQRSRVRVTVDVDPISLL